MTYESVFTKPVLEEIRQLKELVTELIDTVEGKQTREVTREISVGRAASLMGVGTDRVMRYIKSGQLPARRYKDKNNKMRYRIRECDLVAMQEQVFEKQTREREPFVPESVESIADRIFPGRRKKK